MRSEDMLLSALSRPLNQYHYNSEISLFELAAAYGYGIARNHPFADGNKRTAFVISTLFLELNSYLLNSPEDAATQMFQALAAGKVDESELAAWFEKYTG